MKKIFISTSSFAEYDNSAVELLKKKKLSIGLNPYKRKITPEELVKLANDAAGLIAGTEQITGQTLANLPRLKVISRCGTGVDNIDLAAAEKSGIKIFNTPDAATLAVAELTLGLLLNLLRKISPMDKILHNGKWRKDMGSLLFAKKVGIIGFGRIGQKTAELLTPFHCEISYFDLKKISPERTKPQIKAAGIKTLLKTSDIILIHASKETGTASKERKKNAFLLGKEEFAEIKPGAWLINTSRGGTVDERALYNALKTGRLSGAALDVFEKEPYNGKLQELENIILTPHIGSYAKESRIQMELESVKNLLKGLED